MAGIQWNEQMMSTGVDLVDKQHQELIAKLNELLDASQQGKGDAEIGKMLDFLGGYAQRHFADEERVMEKLQCAAAEENKKQHALFLNEFGDLRKKFDAEGAGLAFITLVQTKVVNWLVTHIGKCDRRLRECAQPVGGA